MKRISRIKFSSLCLLLFVNFSLHAFSFGGTYQESCKLYEDAKRKFDNPALFEGTKPLPGGNSPIGVDPSSAGVGIESIPGMSNWGNILDKMNKRK